MPVTYLGYQVYWGTGSGTLTIPAGTNCIFVMTRDGSATIGGVSVTMIGSGYGHMLDGPVGSQSFTGRATYYYLKDAQLLSGNTYNSGGTSGSLNKTFTNDIHIGDFGAASMYGSQEDTGTQWLNIPDGTSATLVYSNQSIHGYGYSTTNGSITITGGANYPGESWSGSCAIATYRPPKFIPQIIVS